MAGNPYIIGPDGSRLVNRLYVDYDKLTTFPGLEQKSSWFQQKVLDPMRSFGVGSNSLLAGAGWVAERVGAEDWGPSIQEFAKHGVEYWQSQLTPETRDALSRDMFDVTDTGVDFNFTKLVNGVAASAPSFVVGLGAGGALAKGLQIFANPIGRSVLVNAVKAGEGAVAGTPAFVTAANAAKSLQMVDNLIFGAAYGGSEGAMAGAAVGAEVSDTIKAMRHESLMERSERYRALYESYAGEDEQQRQALAKGALADEASTDAAWQAGVTTAVLGAPVGAFYGRILGPASTTAFREAERLAGMRGGRAVVGAKGFLEEGAQEALQSAGEQLATNLGVAQGDNTKDVFAGLAEEAISGGIIGGVMGGATGLIAGDPAMADEARQQGIDQERVAIERQMQGNLEVIRDAGLDAEAEAIFSAAPRRGRAVTLADLTHLAETGEINPENADDIFADAGQEDTGGDTQDGIDPNGAVLDSAGQDPAEENAQAQTAADGGRERNPLFAMAMKAADELDAAGGSDVAKVIRDTLAARDDGMDEPNFGMPEPTKALADDHPLLQSHDTDTTPEREAIREELINDRFIGKQAAPADRKPIAIVMGGGGASGKGTILKLLRSEGAIPEGAVELDPDSFKTGDRKAGLRGIPEYGPIVAAGDSRAAAITHEESSALYKRALARGVAGRHDLVLDRTMASAETGIKDLQRLKDAGYEVRMVGATVDTAEALRRAVERAKGPDLRYVPPSALIKAHKGFSKAHGAYVDLVDHMSIYDNNVARGEKPIEIARKEGNAIKVLDQKRYNDFVAKGEIDETATTRRQLSATARSAGASIAGALPADSGAGRGAATVQPGVPAEERSGPAQGEAAKLEGQGVRFSVAPERKPGATAGVQFGPGGATVDVDGEQMPYLGTDGKPVAKDAEGARAYWRAKKASAAPSVRPTATSQALTKEDQKAREADLAKRAKSMGYEIQTAKDGSITVRGDVARARKAMTDAGVMTSGRAGKDDRGQYLQIAPSSAPAARAAILDLPSKTMSGEVYSHQKSADGKIIGAPEGRDTPQMLRAIRAYAKKLATEGEFGKMWYEDSGRDVLDFVGGNKKDADLFAKLLAIYSPQARVDSNTTFAIKAYFQIKAGVKVSVKSGNQDAKAQKAADGATLIEWMGQKTNNFYLNLMTVIDRQKVEGIGGATIDMWMMRAFGFQKDNPSPTQYRFIEIETNAIARELGWKPHQVQAAIWVAMKSRYENDAVKSKTEEESISAGDMTRSGRNRIFTDAAAEARHKNRWLSNSMQHIPDGTDRQKAGFHFGDGLRAHMAQLSWEAVPSTSVPDLAWIHDNMQAKVELQALVSDAIGDKIVRATGLMSAEPVVGIGGWRGAVSPSAQEQIVAGSVRPGGMNAPREVSPEIAERMNVAAAMYAYLLKQDGVGWHRPMYSESGLVSNGVHLEAGRALTEDETLKVYNAVADKIASAFGVSREVALDVAPVPHETGVRFINWGNGEGGNTIDVAGDQKKFTRAVIEAAESSGVDFESADLFKAISGFEGNNWKEDQNGTQIKSKIVAAGFGDQLGQLVDELSPKLAAIHEKLTAKYAGKSGARFSIRGERASGRAEGRDAGAGRSGRQQAISTGGRPAFAARRAQPDAVSVTGVHYSPVAGLKALDPTHAGTAFAGAERKRLGAGRFGLTNPRLNFYVREDGQDAPGRERALATAKHAYTVDLKNLYDIDADPRGLRKTAGQDPDYLEELITEAGFDGFVAPPVAGLPARTAVVFGFKRQIPVAVEAPSQTLFSVAPERQGEPQKGMRKEVVDGLIHVLDWHGKDGIQVYATESDLPIHLQDKIPPGYKGKAQGFFDQQSGSVVVIADAIESPDEAYRVVAEEYLRHRGLRQFFGAQKLDPFLDGIYAGLPRDKIAELASTYGLDTSTITGRRIATEEYIAKIRIGQEKAPIVARIGDFFRGSLRAFGFKLKYTNRDVIHILQQVEDGVRSGRFASSAWNGNGQDPIAPMFSLEGKLAGQPLFSLKRVKGTSAQEQALAHIMEPRDSEMTLGDRVRTLIRGAVDAWKGLFSTEMVQGILDSGASIKEWERRLVGGLSDASTSAGKMYDLVRNPASVLGAVMRMGVPELKGGAFQPVAGHKGLIDVFRPLYEHGGGNLVQLWEGYAAARRSNQLLQQQNMDGTPKEKRMSQAQVDELLSLDKTYPEFAKVFDDWQKFNKQLLDFAVDNGTMSAQMRDLWSKHDYVPFYRVMNDIAGGESGKFTSSRLSGRSVRSKRLTGADAAIEPVMESIIQNAAYILDSVYKNEAMKRTIALTLGNAVTRAPMAFKPVTWTVKQIESALAKHNIVMMSERNVLPSKQRTGGYKANLSHLTSADLSAMGTLFEMTAPSGNDVVSVMQGGTPAYYHVEDPLLLRSIQAIGPQSSSALMKLFSGGKTLLTHAVTADPGFMLVNFMRDTISAWVTSDSPFKPFVDSAKGALSSIKGDPIKWQLQMAGASLGGYYDTRGGDVYTQLRADVGKAPVLSVHETWRRWQKFGESFENANRIAIAKGILDSGGTVAEAAYQALDIMNFSMHGDFKSIRALTSIVPFMNARIQGLYRLYRGSKQSTSFFTRGILGVMAPTIALMAANWDDDRYWELEEFERDSYWHFWLGDEHIKIAKPFEVGQLFGTVWERALAASLGHDTGRLFVQRMASMVRDTFAMDPTPQLVKPLIEQYANKNSFTGRPIENQSMQSMLPEDRYMPWTSETARLFAAAMPAAAPEWMRSPVRVEALVRGYLGTMGSYALQVADQISRPLGGYGAPPAMALKDLPVVRRFYGGDSATRTRYEEPIYQLLNKADQAYRSMMELRKRGMMEESRSVELDNQELIANRRRLQYFQTQMTALNLRERAIWNSDIDADEKKRSIESVRSQRNEMMRSAAELIEKLDPYLPYL